MEYNVFIQNKKHLLGNFGFKANYIPDIAFDFQKFGIEKAVMRGRNAIEEFNKIVEKNEKRANKNSIW